MDIFWLNKTVSLGVLTKGFFTVYDGNLSARTDVIGTYPTSYGTHLFSPSYYRIHIVVGVDHSMWFGFRGPDTPNDGKTLPTTWNKVATGMSDFYKSYDSLVSLASAMGINIHLINGSESENPFGGYGALVLKINYGNSIAEIALKMVSTSAETTTPELAFRHKYGTFYSVWRTI